MHSGAGFGRDTKTRRRTVQTRGFVGPDVRGTVKTRNCVGSVMHFVGSDVRETVETRGFVCSDVRGAVKTRGFVGLDGSGVSLIVKMLVLRAWTHV